MFFSEEFTRMVHSSIARKAWQPGPDAIKEAGLIIMHVLLRVDLLHTNSLIFSFGLDTTSKMLPVSNGEKGVQKRF